MRQFRFGLLRRIEQALRIGVVTGDSLMTAHCALALMGFHPWLGDWLTGYSVTGFLLLLASSYLMNFCWRYRLCLIHSYAVKCCILYEREYGFGQYGDMLRMAMLVSGIVIITANIHAWMAGNTENNRKLRNGKPLPDNPET